MSKVTKTTEKPPTDGNNIEDIQNKLNAVYAAIESTKNIELLKTAFVLVKKALEIYPPLGSKAAEVQAEGTVDTEEHTAEQGTNREETPEAVSNENQKDWKNNEILKSFSESSDLNNWKQSELEELQKYLQNAVSQLETRLSSRAGKNREENEEELLESLNARMLGPLSGRTLNDFEKTVQYAVDNEQLEILKSALQIVQNFIKQKSPDTAESNTDMASPEAKIPVRTDDSFQFLQNYFARLDEEFTGLIKRS